MKLMGAVMLTFSLWLFAAPVSTAASPVTQGASLPSKLAVNGGLDSGQVTGRHRRHRSLLGSLGWNKGGKANSATSSSGDLDTVQQPYSTRQTAASNHALPEPLSAGIDSLPVELGPELPLGTRGIINVGNSCFVSTALQCLRYTPGLTLSLVPDLVERCARLEQEAEAARQKMLAQAAENEGKKSDQQESEPTETSNDVLDTTMESPSEGRPSDCQPEPVIEGTNAPSHPSETRANDPVTHAIVASEESEPSQAAQDLTFIPLAVPLPRPGKGELAAAVADLISELYARVTPAGDRNPPPGVDPSSLLRMLRRFPVAADYFDGGQQDCQEVLQVLLDLLHDDLNRVVKEAPQNCCEAAASRKEDGLLTSMDIEHRNEEGKVPNGSSIVSGKVSSELQLSVFLDESLKANEAWNSWQSAASSPISDLFMGQLQSSVTCCKCGGRFTMYEPFYELSLPLAPKTSGTFPSWLGFRSGGPLTLQDCLRAYTEEERLDGEEAFYCERCKEKTSAIKLLRPYRLPDSLILHVKRFRHKGAGVDKLTTDVAFPLRGLDLFAHLAAESPHSPDETLYDLYAVSYHSGSLAGGHYTACCLVRPDHRHQGGGAGASMTSPGGEWWQFNDDSVNPVVSNAVGSQDAYILFYSRRKFKDKGAAAAAITAAKAKPHSHHGRSRSNGSGGGLFGVLSRSKRDDAD